MFCFVFFWQKPTSKYKGTNSFSFVEIVQPGEGEKHYQRFRLAYRMTPLTSANITAQRGSGDADEQLDSVVATSYTRHNDRLESFG